MAQPSRVTDLPLEFPIEYKGALIATLKVRRPKGSDMRFLPKGDEIGPEDMFPFFALLTGLEEQVIDEMDASDINALGDVVNGFLSRKRRAKR